MDGGTCDCTRFCGDDGDIDGPGVCRALPREPELPLVEVVLRHRGDDTGLHLGMVDAEEREAMEAAARAEIGDREGHYYAYAAFEAAWKARAALDVRSEGEERLREALREASRDCARATTEATITGPLVVLLTAYAEKYWEAAKPLRNTNDGSDICTVCLLPRSEHPHGVGHSFAPSNQEFSDA